LHDGDHAYRRPGRGGRAQVFPRLAPRAARHRPAPRALHAPLREGIPGALDWPDRPPALGARRAHRVRALHARSVRGVVQVGRRARDLRARLDGRRQVRGGLRLAAVLGENKMKKTIAVAAMLAVAGGAAAQGYPSKPIRLMVPFPPGGSTDIVARIVAQKLGTQLGQSLVIENRGGAGGTLGTAVVAKAPADGYLLTVGTTSTHVVAPSVFQKLEYDPVKDFAPISLVAVT